MLIIRETVCGSWGWRDIQELSVLSTNLKPLQKKGCVTQRLGSPWLRFLLLHLVKVSRDCNGGRELTSASEEQYPVSGPKDTWEIDLKKVGFFPFFFRLCFKNFTRIKKSKNQTGEKPFVNILSIQKNLHVMNCVCLC